MGVGEHIGPMRHPGGRDALAPIQGRQGLTRERQHGRPVAELQDDSVDLDYFVSVARPEHSETPTVKDSKTLSRLRGNIDMGCSDEMLDRF